MKPRRQGWGAPPGGHRPVDLSKQRALKRREHRLAMLRSFNRKVGVPGLVAVGTVAFYVAATTFIPWPQSTVSGVFWNCAAARAAGRAPVYRGQPG